MRDRRLRDITKNLRVGGRRQRPRHLGGVMPAAHDRRVDVVEFPRELLQRLFVARYLAGGDRASPLLVDAVVRPRVMAAGTSTVVAVSDKDFLAWWSTLGRDAGRENSGRFSAVTPPPAASSRLRSPAGGCTSRVARTARSSRP